MSARRGPLAVDRVTAVLGLLADAPDGRSLTELARALGAPKSSLVELLRGLATSYHIVAEGRLWRIGPASEALARSILREQPDLAARAAPILQKLALDSGETSILAVMTADERAIEYVAKIESRTAIRLAATVGDRRPLHASAGGRLLTAFRDDEWIDHFLRDARLEAYNPLTVTDPARLRVILRSVREQGFAATAGEVTDGVAGFAVPVRDAQRHVIAALLLGGPIERMAANRERLLALAKRAAEELSAAA